MGLAAQCTAFGFVDVGPQSPELSCSCCRWWARPWRACRAVLTVGRGHCAHSWWQIMRHGDHNEGLGLRGVWASTFLSLLLSAVHSSKLTYRLVFCVCRECVPPLRNLFALFTISTLKFSILKTYGLEHIFFGKCQVHLKPPSRIRYPPSPQQHGGFLHIYFGDKLDSVWSGMC